MKLVPAMQITLVIHPATNIMNLVNNNNKYLECLTHTGPKRLHMLYKYILSKFNAYNMNVHTHTHTHTHTHAHSHSHTCVHIHTRILGARGNSLSDTHIHTHHSLEGKKNKNKNNTIILTF